LDLKDQVERKDFSPCYLAPELISGSSYNEKVDTYAFGVLIWELFSKKTPFASLQPQQVHTLSSLFPLLSLIVFHSILIILIR
jgi:serine/threonine protein kinase